MIKGIDTSKWQASKVDYVEAKKAGYQFVFLRIGYNKTKDKCFEADYASAVKAGLKVGVYFYTLSTTEEQAVADATRVLGWLNNRHLDLPVVYDVEDVKQKSKSRKALNTAMYNAFAGKIKPKYDCMLYTGEYFFNNYFEKSAFKDKVWIAKYSVNRPSVDRDIHFWQYTSEAYSTDFYKAKLDRNYMLIDVFGIENEKNSDEAISNPYAVPTKNVKRTYPMTKGSDVKWVQWELFLRGYLSKDEIDGAFGNKTKSAVISFQKHHGLKQDGIVGPATRYAMLND